MLESLPARVACAGVMLAVMFASAGAHAINLEVPHDVGSSLSETRLEMVETLLDDLDLDEEDDVAPPALPDVFMPLGITPDAPRVAAPATMALVGAALLGLFGIRRRASRRAWSLLRAN